MPEHDEALVARLDGLEKTLEERDRRVDDRHTEFITRFDRVTHWMEDHEKRIRANEKFQYKTLGAAGILGALMGWAAEWLKPK